MSTCIIVINKVVISSLYNKFKDSKYQVIFITDLPINKNIHNVLYYDNKDCDRRLFYGSCLDRGRGWDKCIRFIVENNNFDYYWILEDDVYFKNFNFIEDYKNNNSDFIYPKYYASFNKKWPHFNDFNLRYFKKDIIKGSTSYICRLSKHLVNKILKFKETFKRLLFHEVLFASLCAVFNLKVSKMLVKHGKYLNTMKRDDNINNIMNNNDIELYHPVKNWHRL
jgi:hypothetical protein